MNTLTIDELSKKKHLWILYGNSEISSLDNCKDFIIEEMVRDIKYAHGYYWVTEFLDNDDVKIFQDTLYEEILKPLIENPQIFLNKYWDAYTKNGFFYIEFNFDKFKKDFDVEDYIVRSKKIPVHIKNQYAEWKKDYEGISIEF
jgi:hypothetical protein